MFSISKTIKISIKVIALALIVSLFTQICSPAGTALALTNVDDTYALNDSQLQDYIEDVNTIKDDNDYVNDLMLRTFTYLRNTTDEDVVYQNGVEYNYVDGKLNSIVDAYGNEAQIVFDSNGRFSQVATDDGIIDVAVNDAGFITSYSIENTGYNAQYEYNENNSLVGVIHNDSKYSIDSDDENNYFLTINDEITTPKYDVRDDSSSVVHDGGDKMSTNGESAQADCKLNSEGQISKITYSDNIIIDVDYHEKGISDSDISIRNPEGKLNILQSRTDLNTMQNGELEAIKSISYQQGEDNYEYILNNKGMIEDLYHNGELSRHYEYDNISGQLLTEFNYESNEKIVITYDFSGNILNRIMIDLKTGDVKDTFSYGYNNDKWNDQLTNFNDQELNYDEYGNVLNLHDYSFSWNEKQLMHVQSEFDNIDYTYNEDGIRTSKTVNGNVTEYALQGRNVISEVSKDNQMVYIYDNNNAIVGFILNGENYLYKLNRLNDVIGIYDSDLNQVVSYEYDAWGNLLDVNGKLADSVGKLNPYRFRGYRYDEETNMYYLNSRYYSPELARFISADTFEGVVGNPLSHNLYAYCYNNPVMYVDYSGYSVTLTLEIGVMLFALLLCFLLSLIILQELIPFVNDFNEHVEVIVNTIGTWGRILSEEIANMMQQANVNYNQPNRSPFVIHHIVAQTDYRAADSREVILSNLISVNDNRNKVSIRTSLHQRLHTSMYHAYVSYCLAPYRQTVPAGAPLDTYKYAHVNLFLYQMQGLLTAASALTP